MVKGQVSGYAVKMQGEKEVVSELTSTLVWKKVFEPSSEFLDTTTISSKTDAHGKTTTTITTTQTKAAEVGVGEELITVTHNEINTHGPGRVLGDSSVLWKYLNPHTLVLGTTTSSVAKKYNTEKDNTIHIYLIDVVTGHLLASQVQDHAYPPLHVLSSDNYVVYDYWSSKSHTTQVTVIDMYWTTSGWDRDTFSSYLSLTQFRSNNGDFQLKSKSPFTLESQTYSSPVSLTASAVTVTSHGITNPQLLFGLEGGNVLQVDRRLVDSRRPVREDMKPTPEDMKEGLRPYSPWLEMSPLRFITYNRTVAGLRHIQAAPTQLESTSLVLCQGIDLFYTTVTSGTTYDRLDPDFNTPLLMAVCVVVGMLALVTSFFYKEHLLKTAWK
eukprot:TRINITY_DN5485_c0_g1_i3.p1 TRINITY_DN5485_c0_g1~~TRINITY_DN5485_c0_g1_i3.p1  ORF type:complete len:384 (+),score=81.90 TRINITY_DN5485_c0_g1_i3:1883-3034(+)